MAATETRSIDQVGLAQVLREAGMRATAQRIAILTALYGASDHPTAEELFARAREIDPSVSLATVYRSLSSLEANDIIHRLTFGSDPARFEIAPKSRHDHLVDIDTGEVIEIRSEELTRLRRQIAAEHGYDIVEQQTVWRGRRKRQD